MQFELSPLNVVYCSNLSLRMNYGMSDGTTTLKVNHYIQGDYYEENYLELNGMPRSLFSMKKTQ